MEPTQLLNSNKYAKVFFPVNAATSIPELFLFNTSSDADFCNQHVCFYNHTFLVAAEQKHFSASMYLIWWFMFI